MNHGFPWSTLALMKHKLLPNSSRNSLTVMTPDSVDVNSWVELARPQRLVAVQGVAGAVGRGACSSAVTLSPLLLASVVVLALFLRLLLFPALHVMNAHQQAVVHQLQLGQKLGVQGGGGGGEAFISCQCQRKKVKRLLICSYVQYVNMLIIF